MTIARKLRITVLLVLLACTVGCDQTSKHIARIGLTEAGPVTLAHGLAELRLAENPGSFLSLGASLPEAMRFPVFTLAVGVGLLGLLAYLASRAQLRRLPFIGWTFVLAGGMSNLIDRICRQGVVTDFIILRIGPFHTGVFNPADVMILLGVGLLCYALWKQRFRPVLDPSP